jgi:4-amino-4-deoxy-L-arabinose transferase-like glycosyltransferase
MQRPEAEAGANRRRSLQAWARSPAVAAIAEATLIVGLALTLNLIGNGRIGLFDRDEPRFAGCMRAMRQDGDYIHPTFNGEPRYHKPILIYWLMLAGTAIGGDNPFGLRLVSSFAGAGTCLLTWFWGRRMLGPRVGRLAAFMLATVPIMVVESKMATTDAFLTMLLTVCQVALWALNRRASRFAAAVFWLALALSMLTKGPIGVGLVAASGLVTWLIGGPSACWGRLRWKWGLIGFAALTLPWFVAIGIMTRGEFFRVAVGQQIVTRVVHGLEEHGGFPGYYLVATLLTFYPWSTLLPAAVLGGWARRRRTPDLAVLLGWVIGPLILLECVRTKLVHYYLPAYPACALLAAWLVETLGQAGWSLKRWPLGRIGLGTLTALGIALVVGLLAGVVALPGPIRWPCLALALVVALGTVLAVGQIRAGRTDRGAWSLVGTWGLVMAILGGWLVPSAEPYRIATGLGQRMAALVRQEHATPITANYQEPSLIVGLGRPAEASVSRTWLVDRIERDGAVVMALLPSELGRIWGDPRIDIDLRETVRGFNLNKGRNETLHLVVLKPTGRSNLARRPRQEPLVK